MFQELSPLFPRPESCLGTRSDLLGIVVICSISETSACGAPQQRDKFKTLLEWHQARAAELTKQHDEAKRADRRSDETARLLLDIVPRVYQIIAPFRRSIART